MRPSLILDVVTRSATHSIVVFSLYLLFAGHNAPGGGFVGGLVAGAALVLQYARRGPGQVRKMLPVRHELLLGTGLLLAGGTATVPLLFGAAFLESGSVELHLPLLGTVTLVSPLAFDTGVYLVVVGLVLAILLSLGGEAEGS